MKARQNLPYGYQQIYSLDLQNDKKQMWGVNLAALAVALTMALIMNYFYPFRQFLLGDILSLSIYIIRFVVLIIASIAYIILHELVHGIAMKRYGCQKVEYGFTGLYAYAGSDDYFDKKSYIVIALAPVVFWGIVLLIINLIVPKDWVWVVYIIQMSNISGAAGDIYVTAKFSKMPDDILIKDKGVSMAVFSAENQIAE